MIAEQEIIELKKINKSQNIINRNLLDLVTKLVDSRIELLKAMEKSKQ